MSSKKTQIIYDDLENLDHHTEQYLEIMWKGYVAESILNSKIDKFETFKNDAMIFLKVWGHI
jgi:hypothetical protein|tara:strand:+ start:172 stop:357 length:186 start_codon:yes stop_codon:yes gene_type:complete